MSKLPRVQIATPIVDDNGMLSVAFHRYLDLLATNLEGQLGALQAAAVAQAAAAAAQTTANTAQTTAGTAQTTANTANTAAGAAQTTANGAVATQNVVSSYVTGCTITAATTAGGVATITISAHTRIYGNGTSVAVAGGTAGALAASTAYWVYYDDPTLAGGTVTYAATGTYSVAYANGAMPTRLVVGAITTPAASGSSSGHPAPPPGYAIP